MTASPMIAALINTPHTAQRFRDPSAANAPAANRRESPEMQKPQITSSQQFKAHRIVRDWHKAHVSKEILCLKACNAAIPIELTWQKWGQHKSRLCEDNCPQNAVCCLPVLDNDCAQVLVKVQGEVQQAWGETAKLDFPLIFDQAQPRGIMQGDKRKDPRRAWLPAPLKALVIEDPCIAEPSQQDLARA